MGAGTPLHWKPSPLIFFTRKERGMVQLAGGSAGALAWGPSGGRQPAGRDWLSSRGFSTGQLPAGGRAGGSTEPARVAAAPAQSSGSGSGSGPGLAAATRRQAISGAVLSTPAAGFIWDAGWRRSGGPLAMELFSALIHQMSPRTIAPHTLP